jgi:hypothetical protein
MNSTQTTSFERRNESRHSYSGNIFFATTQRFYEGRLTNFSAHGLFIKTREKLPLGQILTVAIPFLDEGSDKRSGRIVRQTKDGVGVALSKAVPIKNNQGIGAKVHQQKNAA